MRPQLSLKNSTKAERRFAELLKNHRIPFRHRVKLLGREVDFLIGRYAVEIDGHEQDTVKNELLARAGYIPVHLNNAEVGTNAAHTLISCLLHDSPMALQRSR